MNLKLRLKLLLGFIVVFISGIVIGIIFSPKDTHPIKTVAASFPVIQKKGYTLAYDGRNKIPLWVYEEISKEQLNGKANRQGITFREDPNIYPLHRSTLKDYHKNNYDRGHLAPARDFKDSKEKLYDTFYLSNIAPQHPQFNRGYWLKMEKYIRRLAKDHGKVYVITGPLFLPFQKGNKRYVRYEVIGNNDVGVPTHFFKVIRAQKSNGEVLQEAYVIPNKQIELNTPISAFEVTINKLEKFSGLIISKD